MFRGGATPATRPEGGAKGYAVPTQRSGLHKHAEVLLYRTVARDALLRHNIRRQTQREQPCTSPHGTTHARHQAPVTGRPKEGIGCHARPWEWTTNSRPPTESGDSMTTTTDPVAAWDAYDREMSGIAAEMIGAAKWFDAHPEFATDERLAATWRKYAQRMQAVEVPR